MRKKGQVTIFIILALVISFGIVALFIFKSDLSKENTLENTDPFKISFDSCLIEQSEWAVDYVLNKGGVAPLEEYPYFVDLTGDYVPYFIFEKKRVIGNIKTSVEKSTSDVLSKIIYSCMNKSFLINQKNINASYGK